MRPGGRAAGREEPVSWAKGEGGGISYRYSPRLLFYFIFISTSLIYHSQIVSILNEGKEKEKNVQCAPFLLLLLPAG